MNCHLLCGAQNSLIGEPPTPSHKCELTGEPIYKGVRIDGQEYFSIDAFKSEGYRQFYLENGLSMDEIKLLSVEEFTDNGFKITFNK